jgi:hypothetical protein
MSKKRNIVELSVPELLERRKKSGYMMREVKEEDIDYSDIPEVTEELLRTRLKRMPKRKKAF